MDKLMENIGYKFRDKGLLETALTHSSYANENKTQSYERLEFLGDSVLSFIVSAYLYEKYPDMAEGDMSKLRAAIVCERSLESCVRGDGINDHIILNKGELQTGGKERSSIMADVFEAILGAIFIDGGIEPAREFVMSKLGGAIENAHRGHAVFTDYKTRLQEIVQEDDKTVEYNHVKEEGPEHSKIFTVQVNIMNQTVSTGKGKSKKEAEQAAAQSAIKELSKNG